MTLPRWNPEEMRDSVESGMAVLVDLRADWCNQCRVQEPVVERIVPEFDGQVIIGSLDVGEYPEIPDRYGVAGLPAFLLFDRGEHQDMINGYKRAPELRAALHQLLANRSSD